VTNSLELLRKQLPPELLADMRVFAGDGAWHFRQIPDVIEACRVAGLISLGGNLHVAETVSWESWNEQVSVDIKELAGDHLAEESAVLALKRFQYSSEADFIAEGLRGYPGPEKWGDAISSHLFYSWIVRSEI
jgi:hypothetical protein